MTTEWDTYDVPRLWLATRGEGTALGWAQVTAWQTLADHQATALAALRSTRGHLERAWPPEESGIAATVLAQLDDLIAHAEQLAIAAAANTDALHRIVGELAEARSDLDAAQDAWERVTSEWQPEWWDGMATRLNGDARDRMARGDTAVARHGRSVIVPGGALAELDVQPPEDPGPSNLAGPAPATAEPGEPGPGPNEPDGPSTLPIPHGHPLADGGGVYHLPQPGADGWIQSNPARSSPQPAAEPARPRRAVRRGRPGKADCAWEVASGVPGVIGEARPFQAPPADPAPPVVTAWDWVGDPVFAAALAAVRSAEHRGPHEAI